MLIIVFQRLRTIKFENQKIIEVLPYAQRAGVPPVGPCNVASPLQRYGVNPQRCSMVVKIGGEILQVMKQLRSIDLRPKQLHVGHRLPSLVEYTAQSGG